METNQIEELVVAAIRRVIHAVDLHSRRLWERTGLTGPQIATLREVGRLQSAPSGVIARAIHLSQPTVSGILDRLERQGLILRTRSGTDRRTVLVAITAKGSSVLSVAPSLLHDRFRDELCKLATWEQTQMLATLQRVAAMMDTDCSSRPRGDYVDTDADPIEGREMVGGGALEESAALAV